MFEDITGSIIPAQPGYTLIRGFFDKSDDSFFYDETPILAFRYSGGNDLLTPITLTGTPPKDYAVITPSGSCFSFDDRWDDVSGFKFWFEATSRKPG